MPISTLQPVPNCLKPFLPHFWTQKESIKIEYRQGATFPACAIIVIVVVIVVIVIVVVVEDEEDTTTRCYTFPACAIVAIIIVIVVIVIVVVVEDEEDGDVTTRCHLPSLCHRLVGNLWSD